MMNDLIELLHKRRHSLVVANGEVCTFNGRGVIDLYYLLQDDPVSCMKHPSRIKLWVRLLRH